MLPWLDRGWHLKTTFWVVRVLTGLGRPSRRVLTPHMLPHTHPPARPSPFPADLLAKLKKSGGTLLVPSDAFLRAQLTQAGLGEAAVMASHEARSALLASHISYTNLLKVRSSVLGIPTGACLHLCPDICACAHSIAPTGATQISSRYAQVF